MHCTLEEELGVHKEILYNVYTFIIIYKTIHSYQLIDWNK